MPAAIKDREIAKRQGRLHYTGYPCKTCSSDQRYVSNGHCVECSKYKNNMQRQDAADKYAKSEKGKEQQKRARAKYNTRRRDIVLQKTYGISLNDYNNLYISQKECCAICEKHQTTFSKNLFVDHCHSTGKVRGLLCHKCNSGLGQFEDNKAYLEKAILYLQERSMIQT